MNDKLDQIKSQLEEIIKLDIAQQPDAFTALHQQLEEELNSDQGQATE